MRRATRALGIAVASALTSTHSNAAVWAIGQEREVDAGVYFKLIEIQNGWRLWRIETRSGRTCEAIKSATGKPHPQPLGVGLRFWQGTPFVAISAGVETKYTLTPVWRIDGKWSNGEAEYRAPGDRFWVPFSGAVSLSRFDAKQVELHVKSWEYPEIFQGLADERGLINLTGAASMEQKVKDCAAGA